MLDDGIYRYELKRPWSDGTQACLFEPLELMEKLAALESPGPTWSTATEVWPIPTHRRRAAPIKAQRAPPRSGE